MRRTIIHLILFAALFVVDQGRGLIRVSGALFGVKSVMLVLLVKVYGLSTFGGIIIQILHSNISEG